MNEELFNKVLDVVSTVSGYSKAEIISKSKRSDLVDVRCILYCILHKYGMYPIVISRFMRRTTANIRDIIRNYNQRVLNNKYLEVIRKEVEKKLEINHQLSQTFSY